MPAGVYLTWAAELAFASHAHLMLDPEDWPAKRARLLEHDVWVTRHERDGRSGTNVFDRHPAIDLPAGPK